MICRCGADVRWAEIEGEFGQKVLIDSTPSFKGPNRFREVGYRPLTVERVPEDAETYAYPEHVHPN
jgi:hypothetical protein